MKMPKTQTTSQEFDLKLRPYHVIEYLMHEAYPEWFYVSDETYTAGFRKGKGDFHSDEFIQDWRWTIKRLHENPDLKVKYTNSLDTICETCEGNEFCSDENHWAYNEVQEVDRKAIERLPELKLGEVYTGHDLMKTGFFRRALEEKEKDLKK